MSCVSRHPSFRCMSLKDVEALLAAAPGKMAKEIEVLEYLHQRSSCESEGIMSTSLPLPKTDKHTQPAGLEGMANRPHYLRDLVNPI